MTPFIITGELNRDYISGLQHRKIDSKTKSIVEKVPPKGLYLERKTINRMMPVYLTRNGILSDNKPIPGFKPNPADPEADEQAVEGNRFFTEFTKEIDYDKFYKKLIAEADVFPLAWVKSGINWTKGDKVFTTKVEAQGEEKEISVYEGRPFIDVIPIYEGFPDSVRVGDASELSEFVHRRPFHLDYIKKKYGLDVKPESINANYIPKGTLGIMNSLEDDNHAYVYEYYRAADSEYPKGRFVIMVSDQIVWDADLPFENGENGKRVIPFDCVRLQTVPGFLPGISIYSQLIDQQDSYNAVYNRMLEYINRIGIGKKYVWKGSLLHENDLSNRPGDVTMLTRFGRKPENDNIDPIGMEFITYLRTLEENMLITAGLSALTAYGQSKSNVRTDGVADKIAESDSNKLSNAMKNLSESLTSVMRKIVNLEKQRQRYLTDELKLNRIDKYLDKYNILDVDASQVMIVNREFLMQSDQVIEKKMLQAANLGVYNPQAGLSYRAKLSALDMIQANYLKETLDPMEASNWNQIQSEHKKLFDEKPIEVKPYQNHGMHIMEHQMLLMSPKIEKLKHTNKALHDFIVLTLEQHIAEHSEYDQTPQQQQVFEDAKAMF